MSFNNSQNLTNILRNSAPITTCLNYLMVYVLIPVGVVGNSVAFVVYTRKVFRNTAFGVYFATLVVNDTLVSLVRLMNRFGFPDLI